MLWISDRYVWRIDGDPGTFLPTLKICFISLVMAGVRGVPSDKCLIAWCIWSEVMADISSAFARKPG